MMKSLTDFEKLFDDKSKYRNYKVDDNPELNIIMFF